jgi:hypothetical protein
MSYMLHHVRTLLTRNLEDLWTLASKFWLFHHEMLLSQELGQAVQLHGPKVLSVRKSVKAAEMAGLFADLHHLSAL